MPKYSMQQEQKPRDIKRQQRQENDFTQQNLDQRGQDSMVNQLGQLYGISSNEQTMPAKLDQMGAQTRGMNANAAAQEFENQWAQPNAEASYGLKQAQTGLAQSAATQKEGVSPQAIPYLVQMGIITPEEAAKMVLTPEMQAGRAAGVAQKEQERQVAMAADQKMQGAPAPHPQSQLIPNMMNWNPALPMGYEWLQMLQGKPSKLDKFGKPFAKSTIPPHSIVNQMDVTPQDFGYPN